MKKYNCTRCKREIEELEIFPEGLCVTCHGVDYDKNEAKQTTQQKAEHVKYMGQKLTNN